MSGVIKEEGQCESCVCNQWNSEEIGESFSEEGLSDCRTVVIGVWSDVWVGSWRFGFG